MPDLQRRRDGLGRLNMPPTILAGAESRSARSREDALFVHNLRD
jgi:hypothetical protein